MNDNNLADIESGVTEITTNITERKQSKAGQKPVLLDGEHVRRKLAETPRRVKESFKSSQVWGFFVSLAVMALVSMAFFYPDNFRGNSLAQYDMVQGMANGQEGVEYYNETGEKALWTNALFSGMPTFQISPEYPSNSLFTWINSVYGLGLPAPSNLMFMMMFGFLIMLYCLRLRWWYALIGALAWGLSSYFVIIIGAGHLWKFIALAYAPPTIGALIMIYRGRYVTGAAILALFMMLELNANHPQITYYFAYLIILLAVAFFIEACMRRTLKKWLAASVIAVFACALAFGANLPSLYNTYEYSKETKRAASELTPVESAQEDGAVAEAPTGGLPKSEIGGWANLPEESFSLLIPNIKGGATIKPIGGRPVAQTLDNNPHFDYRMAASEPYVRTPDGQEGTIPLFQSMTEYFGGKGTTNGPFYVGALIFSLFILGCFIVRGPIKWVLLITTVFSVFLAMGNYFGLLTDFMIYNVPLFNKFRAAETALVLACLCMPLLAILALNKLFTLHNPLKDKQIQLGLSVAFIFPLFVCVVAYVSPSVFGSALTPDEANYLATLPQQFDSAGYSYDPAQIQATADNIQALRYSIVSDDALRSMIVLIIGSAVILLSLKYRINKALACLGVGIVITVDLFAVDKRYVDHDSFVVRTANTNTIVADEADKAIMADTSYYRVADLEGFTKAERSYFHHMVGGYHAAKLNRYNDLLERMMYPEINNIYKSLARDIMYGETPTGPIWNVLSMLNTKYIIYPLEGGSDVYVNAGALGPAWLVDDIKYVDNADAEMAALQTLDPSTTAVADRRFRDLLGDQPIARSQGDYIRLVKYTPNAVTYSVDTRNGGLAVFSEVWFPWGWHAIVDGQEMPLGRVNYVLRAMRLPAGKHTVELVFDPQSIHVTSAIAYTCITLIYLLCALALFVVAISNERPKNDDEDRL